MKTSILRVDSSGTTVVDADLDQSEADCMIYNDTQEAMSISFRTSPNTLFRL
ncbi:hypothetical protein ACFL6U_29545 [Planctomycetota bacterium]